MIPLFDVCFRAMTPQGVHGTGCTSSPLSSLAPSLCLTWCSVCCRGKSQFFEEDFKKCSNQSKFLRDILPVSLQGVCQRARARGEQEWVPEAQEAAADRKGTQRLPRVDLQSWFVTLYSECDQDGEKNDDIFFILKVTVTLVLVNNPENVSFIFESVVTFWILLLNLIFFHQLVEIWNIWHQTTDAFKSYSGHVLMHFQNVPSGL